jgi:peptidylprolyl isomerase
VNRLAPTGLLWAALALVACGGGSAGTGEERAGAHGSNAEHEIPRISLPLGPPPKKLVVRELRKGSGPAITKADDEILVNYAAAEYATGQEFFNSWEELDAVRYRLEETRRGWEIGMKGMRPGGVRELLLPSRLAYGTGAQAYLVELVALNSGKVGSDGATAGRLK